MSDQVLCERILAAAARVGLPSVPKWKQRQTGVDTGEKPADAFAVVLTGGAETKEEAEAASLGDVHDTGIDLHTSCVVIACGVGPGVARVEFLDLDVAADCADAEDDAGLRDLAQSRTRTDKLDIPCIPSAVAARLILRFDGEQISQRAVRGGTVDVDRVALPPVERVLSVSLLRGVDWDAFKVGDPDDPLDGGDDLGGADSNDSPTDAPTPAYLADAAGPSPDDVLFCAMLEPGDLPADAWGWSGSLVFLRLTPDLTAVVERKGIVCLGDYALGENGQVQLVLSDSGQPWVVVSCDGSVKVFDIATMAPPILQLGLGGVGSGRVRTVEPWTAVLAPLGVFAARNLTSDTDRPSTNRWGMSDSWIEVARSSTAALGNSSAADADGALWLGDTVLVLGTAPVDEFLFIPLASLEEDGVDGHEAASRTSIGAVNADAAFRPMVSDSSIIRVPALARFVSARVPPVRRNFRQRAPSTRVCALEMDLLRGRCCVSVSGGKHAVLLVFVSKNPSSGMTKAARPG
jgi:hypothetical protein